LSKPERFQRENKQVRKRYLIYRALQDGKEILSRCYFEKNIAMDYPARTKNVLQME
jgi:hypothetical protein